MRPILWTSSIVLFSLALGVQAGHPQTSSHRYRWVDAAGLPHYSDSLSVKALKFGYEVLDASGRVLRRVPAEMTAAERKQAEAKAARASSSRQAALEQLQRDRQMLMAYPTEASFRNAQQARIDSLDEHIRTTRLNLDSQERNLAQLLTSAADYGTQGKPVPHTLARRIAEQRQAVNTQRELLKRQQANKVELGKQVATELAHYRQLRAKQQTRYGQ